MTEQLVFELSAPEPPSFANFLPGRNGEALAAVQSLVEGRGAETGVVLWGAEGGGKTHLLRAAVRMAEARRLSAAYFALPGALLAQDPEALGSRAVVAVDGVDLAPADAQARMFRLFNDLKERGGRLIVASLLPPAALELRDDLRTRLGWGLVFEILPLTDADKPAALRAFARQRGFRLADEVVDYLLAHGRRDMPALLATLAALDRHSLAAKRPITVPLLRDWLQREIGLER